MKAIKLEKFEEISTVEVLKSVVEMVPRGQGVNLEDMRWRLKMVDQIEAATDELLVEDADHSRLLEMVTNFPFAIVNASLVKIGEAVERAETVKPAKA